MARILIIEDNPANLELMAFLLGAHGHRAVGAPDGVRGIAAARAEPPDLVACDLNLPGMDGFAVLAALRAEPVLAGVPVLAVTALAMAGDREKVLAAGFDGYISKPIEPDSFVAELEAFLPAAASAAAVPSASPSAGTAAGAPAAAAPRPGAAAAGAPAAGAPAAGDPAAGAPVRPDRPTVLLVDDDAFMLAVLADMLGEEPVRVLGAASGQEALDLLAREPVDVILCDQAMPGMNGTEVLAQVAERHPRIVRLMLTGQQDRAEIESALRSGVADAHYAKPVSAASLRERIQAALALRRSRDTR